MKHRKASPGSTILWTNTIGLYHSFQSHNSSSMKFMKDIKSSCEQETKSTKYGKKHSRRSNSSALILRYKRTGSLIVPMGILGGICMGMCWVGFDGDTHHKREPATDALQIWTSISFNECFEDIAYTIAGTLHPICSRSSLLPYRRNTRLLRSTTVATA